MNTINILVRQCIIIQHPYMVEIYKQFDIRDAFEPIKLTCSVDNNALTKTESNYGKLPMVVTYHTFYIEKMADDPYF